MGDSIGRQINMTKQCEFMDLDRIDDSIICILLEIQPVSELATPWLN